MSEPSPDPEDLRHRLAAVSLRDERRLRRRLDAIAGPRPATADRAAATGDAIAAELAAAEQRVARRRAAVPTITYPEELPVSQRRDEIAAAIRDHQVVIVAGETGSGKTTQLPKICLELGRGIRGLIGHTQPRRLAARTVADRIADELGVPLNESATVGYQVRFTDHTRDDTLVKLMTDGILLTEIRHDRGLYRYDTLIIDEAHERSLNIDFILGYLKQLLPRRKDLKVVITSATIETERFSKHFGDAPVIEVSGRVYPVEVRYEPVNDPDQPNHEPRDQVQAVCDVVANLSSEAPGDILVFLSGEREIRDTAEALRKANLRNMEILPLYARLSAAEQHRVFQPHPGRRTILATNVAETSLTVPGIRYVVDPGTARISRYSHRTKVQRLPIEPVSQASANQRKGRCGRVADGVCVRLYTEDDFNSRPEYTEAEILRTNLASVILQMIALGLGDIADFPFIDPPDRRNITAGIQLLEELGALDPHQRLTDIGRKLAQLPIDPRLGRMVLEAGRNGCVHEVLVIAAGLSIQDPRERPAEHKPAADEKHARFADPTSDFLAYLNLWEYLQQQQKERSSSGFRRMCRDEFFNYLRVREWQDLYGQLRQVARTLGAVEAATKTEDPQRIHTSLLAGLLSHVGLKDPDKHEYLGARGTKFALWPGSALFKKPPRWVVAAELVETSRLWGRIAARIEPEWVEPLAGHLVKREYSEARWDAKAGAVKAYERVTLYGVPLVAQRTVNYGRIDPQTARELFIRHALVEGDWQTHHRFFHDNARLKEQVEELEHRARRRDILVDDQVIFDFYDRRIPADIVSSRHFDAWWKRTRQKAPTTLNFDRALLVSALAGTVSPGDFPDVWRQDGLELPLSYTFEPGRPDDGVTATIPLPLLGQVRPAPFEWQVPGLRAELLTALIRTLPKQVRKHFVPVPDTVADLLDGALADAPTVTATSTAAGTSTVLDATQGEPLLEALERALLRLTGVAVRREDWQVDKVPGHLRMTFKIIDEHEEAKGEGKDLTALKAELRGAARAAVAAAGSDLERTGQRDWTFGELPRSVTRRLAGFEVTAYPALVDEGDSVGVRLFESEAEQVAAGWNGTRRLLLLGIGSPVRPVVARLSNHSKLALGRNPHGGVPALLDDCVAAAVDKLVADAGGPAWDADGFAKLRDRVRADLVDTTVDTVAKVVAVLGLAYPLRQRLATMDGPAADDVRAQLDALVYKGFVTATGWWRLPDLPRYLRAVERRLDRLASGASRDRELMSEVQQVQREYEHLRAQLPPSAQLFAVRWMIEELRVSLFAQNLGTPYPVSATRIYRAMDQLGA